MSAASAALSAGFDALLGACGESVTFRGATITAVIDRDPFRRVLKTPDFNPRDQSVVEIQAEDVASIPTAREVFEDEEGLRHAIQFVSRRGGTYRCECKVTDRPPALLTGAGLPLLAGAGGPLMPGKP